MNVLFNGAEVPPFGSTSGPAHDFAMTAVVTPPPAATAFPKFMQWQYEAENLGDRGVRIVNFVGSGIKATRGVGERSNVITVEQIDTGPAPDPFFDDVLLLLSGTGAAFDDSSCFNRAVFDLGADFDSVDTLFGNPTYHVTGGASNSRVAVSGGFISSDLGGEEWCFEEWLRIDSLSGSSGQFTEFGQLLGNVSADGSFTMAVANIGGSIYTIGGPAGTFTFGVWHHLAFVRDNSAPGTFGFLKLYLDGVLIATSAGIAKTEFLGNGDSGTVFGSIGVSVEGRVVETRFTWKHGRYYAPFTPPTEPFVIMPCTPLP